MNKKEITSLKKMIKNAEQAHAKASGSVNKKAKQGFHTGVICACATILKRFSKNPK